MQQSPLRDQKEPGIYLERTQKINTKRIQLLGIPIDAIDFSEALSAVKILVQEASRRQKTALVFTPNAEIIVKAHDDLGFRQILQSADLVVPDGSSLLWAAKFLQKPLKTRVTGIDLMQLLLKEANKCGWSVYFLGAKPEVVKKAASNTKERYPSLKLVGYHHGYFDDDALPLKEINDLKPDLLFAGMGAPKQERWLSINQEKLNCQVAIGVGGSFDVLSGNVKRAPMWLQKRGLEWLYRYVKEPSRIKRSILLPRFISLVFKEKIKTLKGEKTT